MSDKAGNGDDSSGSYENVSQFETEHQEIQEMLLRLSIETLQNQIQVPRTSLNSPKLVSREMSPFAVDSNLDPEWKIIDETLNYIQNQVKLLEKNSLKVAEKRNGIIELDDKVLIGIEDKNDETKAELVKKLDELEL